MITACAFAMGFFGIRIFLPESVTVGVNAKLYAELSEDCPSRPCGDFHLISVRP